MWIQGELHTSGPSCSGGCDVVFSPGYQLDSIEEHAAKMWAESYLPAVGPTPEDGAPFNLTEKTGDILSELEKAHIYIEQVNDKVKTLTAENRGQQQTIQALREELHAQDAAQAAVMAQLEQRLAALEASDHRGSH